MAMLDIVSNNRACRSDPLLLSTGRIDSSAYFDSNALVSDSSIKLS